MSHASVNLAFAVTAVARRVAGALGRVRRPSLSSMETSEPCLGTRRSLDTRRCRRSSALVAGGAAGRPRWHRVFSGSLVAACACVAVHSAAAQELPPGTLVGWGSNQYGESSVPAGLTDIKAIATGSSHSLALTASGMVVGWGRNDFGQITIPPGLAGARAIAAGARHSLALGADGTVLGWGDNSAGQTAAPAGLADVKAIASGESHNLALKADGTVVAWGDNTFGQASVPPGLVGVKAIAAGNVHSLALKTDGTIVAWGFDIYGQASVPAGLTGVKAIAAGNFHNLALKTDGTVVAWGFNSFGQTDVPSGLTDVQALAGGGLHSLALKVGGVVVGWGYNFFGQAVSPPGLTGAHAIAAGDFHNLAANVLAEYAFIGFLQPTDNPPAVNLGKAGRSYPIKWQLKDAAGQIVSALSAVSSISFKPTACGQFDSVATDTLETETSGKSGLRYDALTEQFTFIWATPTAGGCYTLFLILDDGQVQRAFFNLRK